MMSLILTNPLSKKLHELTQIEYLIMTVVSLIAVNINMISINHQYKYYN